MAVEIERKFLVNKSYWQALQKPAGTLYKQGYLFTNDNLTVRIRLADKKSFITLKGKTEGYSRSEFEYEIPYNEGEDMLKQFGGNLIEKTRYKIHTVSHVWEVDEFSGLNEGLIIAEVELKSEDEKFDKPNWVAEEVSDDIRYYNSSLSKNPFTNW